MIFIKYKPIETRGDALTYLQMAVGIEFGTLPPYLYALYSILPGENKIAYELIKSVAMEEMIHMCLVCNIMNAIGGDPKIIAPRYPGYLPGGLGPDGHPLSIHLYKFSPAAMAQAKAIEEPEGGPIDFPTVRAVAAEERQQFTTIGQFYHAMDDFLKDNLSPGEWAQNRNQIADNQFFAGRLFAVNSYDDAHRAISNIVSEGEGSHKSPLDFQGEVAHYYRFDEIFRNKVLTKANNPEGYTWSGDLGVDWTKVYPAIEDPGAHDFSNEPPAAVAAQDACDVAYTQLVTELQRAVSGESGRLGNAVRAMFDLRMAATHAFTVPLADATQVSGPSFLWRPIHV